MKCFNITDVETPNLKGRNMVNVTVVLGGRSIAPGQCVELPDVPPLMQRVSLYEKAGVVAVDEVPDSYVAIRAKMAAAAGKTASKASSKAKGDKSA